eukprot:c17573_g1_i2.p1 GENE.c17573_g1_i2~~c17573_g1_i2.p1  ORF type:complete len:197 (-),score=33.24 c17573_g1_i2:266-856(-)
MSIRDQIHFRGSSPCSEFVPNMLKPSMCRDCLKLMAAHSSDAVKSDNQIKQALEYMSDKVASKILDESDDLGALFLGGYKSVTNAEFMVEAKITHVVNTAGSLDIFGPHYSRSQKQLKSLGITFHELPLLDLQSFQIDPQLMFNAIHFIWQVHRHVIPLNLLCLFHSQAPLLHPSPFALNPDNDNKTRQGRSAEMS